MKAHTDDAREAEEDSRVAVSLNRRFQGIPVSPIACCSVQVKIAIYASLIANFCLCVLQCS